MTNTIFVIIFLFLIIRVLMSARVRTRSSQINIDNSIDFQNSLTPVPIPGRRNPSTGVFSSAQDVARNATKAKKSFFIVC